MELESLYSFLFKRIMAAADEIFDCVKENLTEYKKEIERLKQQNYCLRRRICSCAETCHDTQRDGVLQVKLEFANHEPLSQASFNTSPLSEGVSGQESPQCLSLLPENKDNTQSSITVKSEQCDELLVTEQEPSSVQRDLESFQGVLRRQRRKRQDALCKICGKQEHERIHKGDYRHSCPKCGRGFSRSNHVRDHLKASRCHRSSSSRK
uniref:C2H2-type domain-containing protein n=1 Tax=Sinocyclocheilus anshuiensis TaxID=1608454 RepID=A0A671JZU1_9TELE